jgi:ribosomal protein S16
MLAIRFKPIGRKHSKMYRIVVTYKQSHPTKKFLESLGWYNPYSKACAINQEKLKKYLDLNIEISDSVKSLLVREKLIVK